MNSLKARITYWDTAKAYLIIMVVVGHILIVLNPGYEKIYFSIFQEFLSAFHMPAFFIIHGILFNTEKWRNVSMRSFVQKKAYAFLVPYLFFELIGIAWKAIFCGQKLSVGFYNLLTVRCNVGADWFLIAIFMANILFLVYAKCANNVYAVVSAIICFVFPMFMSGNQLTIVVGRAMLAYGFIAVGHLGKRIFQSEKTANPLYLLGTGGITAVVALVTLKYGQNDFYGCIINHPIAFVIGGVSGTFWVIGIARILQCKILSIISKHTLTIMGTHQLMIYALTVLVPGIKGGNALVGFGLLATILVFEIPVIWLIDRYLPFCIGKRGKSN